MSWWWRTKPRSALKTVQWFSDFGKLENANWNETDKIHKKSSKGKTIHPVRRQYVYQVYGPSSSETSYSDFLIGKGDKNDVESLSRQDKHAFELFGFGFVDKKGIINVTPVGRRILDKKFDDEDYLKQLLKLRFPNPVQGLNTTNNSDSVVPLQILCQALDKFKYLNRSELVLLFGCNTKNDIEKLFTAIETFREKYNSLPNKNNKKDVRKICSEQFAVVNGTLDNKIGTYYDYADAFCRSLTYTGIFKTSGRSDATQIKVAAYSKTKFDLLLKSYNFDIEFDNTLEKYMEWFGNPDATPLPWDSIVSRKTIIQEKIEMIKRLKDNKDFVNDYPEKVDTFIEDVISKANKMLRKSTTLSDFKDVEKYLVGVLTTINEKKYIYIDSKTRASRKEILKKYDEIIKSIDDMGALWLEVNTWKSLLAINGSQEVKRNFQIEEDLSPKSFAPGIGNTPDMEMYIDDFIVIPEVSLMTGIQQWEHEASSVIDHVYSFIEGNKSKKVIGLFISSSINIRTKWQFFILNRESWIATPVPVVPMTIKQYKEIIEVFYNKDLDIFQFINLISKIKECAFKSNNYSEWFENTQNIIGKWKAETLLAQ